MIRILHVLGSVDRGGAESRIMDLMRNIDRDKYAFDYAVHTDIRGAFQDEIENLGGNVYVLPRFKVYNYINYCLSWRRLLKEHQQIRVVHGHMTSIAGIYIPIAKQMGVSLTIGHARSAGVEVGIKGILTRIFRHNLIDKVDIALACSELAGEAVYGEDAMRNKSVNIIPNAIRTDKFAYDTARRNILRQELFLEGKVVIGHVGRFDSVKNHMFLLQILASLNSFGVFRLLLVGDGELRSAVRKKAIDLGIEDSVVMVGEVDNVWDYYSVMDIFLLPSLYEGLPGSAIEAQASGLPCILSDTITREVRICDEVYFEDIDVGATNWCNLIKILVSKTSEESEYRSSAYRIVADRGFDVSEQVRVLEGYYESVKER